MQILTRILLYLPLLLLAVSAHEAAHAWAALRLGDDTAAKQGRVSLLPFSHVDLWGTLILPLLLLALQSPFLIGYAKPTPVDAGKLRRPKRDFSLVAVAGPLGNLALAVGLAALGALLFGVLGLESPEGQVIVAAGIFVNALLACLNLLPLPGFDGLKALYAFLPERWCWRLQRADSLFFLVLALAAFTRVLDLALWPARELTQTLCIVAGIPWPQL
jgi:Zn-dependent protease